MQNWVIAAGAALLLAGCSEEGTPQPEAETAAKKAALEPGLYDAKWTVTELRSTDDTSPATTLAKDGTGTSQVCVGDGGALDIAMFAEAGETCEAQNSYMRGGRISMQLQCRRPASPGQVSKSVNGSSTADSFEIEASTTTYFAGSGDYSMTRTFAGSRVGDCPAGGAPAGSGG